MNHVTELISNLKSPDGNEYRVPLGQHTILIGDNESGKSAIAESAQLALTGIAHGLLYRDKPIKDGTLLSALIPESAEKGVVSAYCGVEKAASWELSRGSKPKHSPPKSGMPMCHSISELHGVMAGSQETKVKYFWELLCYSQTSIGELMELLPEALHEALVLVCPVDRKVYISDVVDKAAKIQRQQNTVMNAGRIALESLGSVRSVTEDELQGTWKTLQRAMLRDVLRVVHADYKADPTLQANHVLAHLVKMLGGKEAVVRIPDTDALCLDLGETLLNRRLARAASAAKSGEVRAGALKEGLRTLKEALIRIMYQQLATVADKFIASVSKFLPGEEEFLFTVDSSSKKLTMGLARDGGSHIALSGSTEARVLAAIASATAGSYDLIVVDDRMWDADTLKKTLTVLEKSKAQVIVMSTIRPKGRKRGAWTYVEVSRTPGESLGIAEV